MLEGRAKKIDLSGLRCLVIDEADFFFEDQNNKKQLMALHEQLVIKQNLKF
jgi:hypothetical protein